MKWLQAVVRGGTTGAGPDPDAAQRGQGMVEYALILVLVALAVIAALTFLGGQISGVFHNITTVLQQNSPH